MSHDPPPDPTAWLKIHDPTERVVTALSEIYSHYERNEQMTENVFRDMHLVDSMRSYNLPLVEESFAAMTKILGSAYGDEAGLAVRRKAVVSVAISFNTWKTLVRVQQLSDDQAVDLMSHAVECVGQQRGDTR